MAFHWSQGAALLNQKLSTGLDPSDRDPIWACAGLLGALTCSSIHAKTPEEAWPLKQSSSSDLDWLKMSEGKKAIWKIADPLRPDSVFHRVAPDFSQYASVSLSSMAELQKLPPELLQLCKLDDASKLEHNPYLVSASFLAQTINIECNSQTVGIFLSFFGCMHEDYRLLLAEKDPCAMLLLAYWYAKVSQCQQWWLWPRAYLECQSICRYLTCYHGNDSNILSAVRYPETICATQALLGTKFIEAATY
ncbi:hypothetical protein MMC13_000760 [Lambiella insularis]|nr:hypothetical protein [Lambiella insularis]